MMTGKTYNISVIVPVYNERGNIEQFHKQLVSVLGKNNQSYEIIYIDDNSTDGTWEFLSHQVIKSSSHKDKSIIRRSQSHEDFRREDVKTSLGDVKVFRKAGKKGKAFSLKEGFDKAQGSVLVMIDGDLQYPPHAMPQMISELKSADIVVAQRKNYKDSFMRKQFSNGFRYFFGKLLFGLSTDIQSGLKVFKREVYQAVKFEPVSPWTFDLEFLYRAKKCGFIIKNIDITFAHRFAGVSKVSVLKQTWEIGINALYLKYKRVKFLPIPPIDSLTMMGAGVGYKERKYITHTTLPISLSALETFSVMQRLFLLGVPSAILLGLLYSPLDTARVLVAILSTLYFTDALFNLFIVTRSLRKDNEISIAQKELDAIDEGQLPMYTILCPLYKEAQVVPQFLEAMAQIDWPKHKLDVLFLLEEDDQETIEAFSHMTLPYYARTVIVPDSLPKTKPKACNYGLSFARGEYLVIYDAEDIPDPLQLKKAYLGFQKVPDTVKCLQAKLNYYNTRHNLLTRLFTAEYSLWFDVTLTGLQSLNSIIPLGGTSNHFKTEILKELQGWDPFNVTEDADLGMRLFQKGYQTAIIESTTMEEATSKAKNWLRQRSRWIKGYMQTYLVYTRHMGNLIKRNGFWHSFIFQFTVGGKILFLLLNPLMWILTFLYFTSYPIVGPTIEAIYVPPISYIAVSSWIFGNFLFFYYYMIGVGKRSQWDIAKYVFLIPFYWVMMSTAGAIAFYQLLFKPHYWEKTVHGFHLGSPKPVAKAAPVQPAFGGAKPAIQPTYINLNSNIEYRNSKQTSILKNKNAQNVLRFSHLNFGIVSDFGLRISNFGLNSLPLFSVLILDVFMVGYVLTPDTAVMYLLMSFFAKIALLIMQINMKYRKVLDNNLSSFVSLFHPSSEKSSRKKGMRILVFNWRDTKHIFAGGAEVYVHELAKRWVRDGNKVTVFCGSDNRNPANEMIDGVEIIRRGGTYTIYLFAFIYYVLKLRGKYDVVIDCENGIPFFTPLFTRLPVVLLIHHVHQEVFRIFLKFPLNHIAAFLEGKVMPYVYKDRMIVTVSDSSRREIIKLGFTHALNIRIITNGVSSGIDMQYPKTAHPSFVYLGRLKEYKNIDVALQAFAQVLKEHPDAVFSVVGSGEKYNDLAYLTKQLSMEKAVRFYGRVSEKEKTRFLAQSWVAMQPSSLEGWGITVVEANAAGTPVIASKVNGLQDSVIDGQTGLLVENGQIQQFAAAMKNLIVDGSLRERLSQNAVNWAYNFDWDRSARDFYNLLSDAIAFKAEKKIYTIVSFEGGVARA